MSDLELKQNLIQIFKNRKMKKMNINFIEKNKNLLQQETTEDSQRELSQRKKM